MRTAIVLLLCALSLTATAQDFFSMAPRATTLEADDPVPADFREQLPEPKVVLFSAEWCDYCKVLHRRLDEADIDYLSLDIETNPLGKSLRALFPGGDFVPVTVIGDGVVFGADPDRIIALARQ
ncbi:MAG TPA: hypothetical protein PK027_14630 [Aquimonas sp.]|jgi:mycoredoxin|nr:hypothetical protein [Xanthomonadales bacterium]HRD72104.1 hypothetical protein [Aquimonas sp.]HRF55678.1 hypothetical protein [Aquimonas sp.]